MRLRGVIVVVGRIQSVILADDETMHSFSTSDWRSDEASLDVGTPVSFEIQDSNAVDVRPIADTAATPDDALPDVVSQGTIRRVARADRPGMIEGDDGAEYTYTLSDWEVDSFNPIAGMRVDFAARGSSAASVRLPGAPARTSGAAQASSPRVTELPPKPSDDSEKTDAPVPALIETVADADGDTVSPIDLQGTIRRVARADRPGMIQGDDGGEYTYTSDDWQIDSFNPASGMRVDFVARGATATTVRLLGRPPQTSASANVNSPRSPRLSPKTSEEPEEALPLVSVPSETDPDSARRRTRLRRPVQPPSTFHIIRRRAKVVAVIPLILIVAIVAVVGYALIEAPHPDYSTTYAGAYNDSLICSQYSSGRAACAELIDYGFSESYAQQYADTIESGKSPTYARAYAHTKNHAYAQMIDAGNQHWYASNYAATGSHAYAEIIESGLGRDYAKGYKEMIENGESSTYARTYADARFVYFLAEDTAHEIANEVDLAPSLTISSPIDAVVVLVMYSTTDSAEADRRAASIREMTTYLRRDDMDDDTLLDLLNDIAPEASIDERAEAATRLATFQATSDGKLIQEQTLHAANELTRLIIGHGIDAEQRAEAAREMVRLSQSGELNGDNAAELMETIAPEWSVEERREALGYLAWQFSEGEWDADSVQRTAEEGYTLLTGGEIQLERRMEASVGLAAEGLKQYGGDSYDDAGVDKAAALMQEAIGGDLSVDTVTNILGIGVGNQGASNSSGQTKSKYDKIYDHQVASGESRRYARAYAETVVAGASSTYGRAYAEQIDGGQSEKYAHAYAGQIISGKSENYAHAYARQRDAGKSVRYTHAFLNVGRMVFYDVPRHRYLFAHTYAKQIDDGKSEIYAYMTAFASKYYQEYLDGNSKTSYSADPDDHGYKTYIRTYMEQLDSGKPSGYARTYTEKILDGKSDNYAHIYAKQIGEGRSYRYAQAYANALVSQQKEIDYAYVYAHAYAQTQAIIDEGGGLSLRIRQQIRACDQTQTTSDSDGVYTTFCTSSPAQYARLYSEQIVAGKSGSHARFYAKQVIAGKPPTYARAYAEQIISGRSKTYATLYGWSVYLISGRW